MSNHVPRLQRIDDSSLSRIALARRLLWQGRHEEALVEIDKALSVNPELAEAYILKGSALAARRQPEEAARCLDLGERLEPSRSELWFLIALTRGRLDDPRGALAAVEQAIRAGQDDARAHVLRGRLLLMLERKEEAVESFRAAMRRDPRNVFAPRAIAVLSSSDEAPPGRPADERLRLAARAARLSGCDVESRVLIGDTHRQRGDWEEAIVAYRSAVQADPWSPLPFQRLGVLYLERGLLTEAHAALVAAIKRDPTERECYDALGRVYEQQGRRREAAAMFRRAREIDASPGRDDDQGDRAGTKGPDP